MAIQLTPKTEALIEEMISTGNYVDASEVIEQAVRFLEAHERKQRLIRSVSAAREAVDRGEFYEDTDEFWESLERDADERDRQGIPINPDVLP